MKNLKFELLKTARARTVILAVTVLLIVNMFAAFYLGSPDDDAATDGYAGKIAALIADTERMYNSVAGNGGFPEKYYAKIIDTYSALDDASPSRAISGWGRFMCFEYQSILAVAACVFVSAFGFRRERESRELPIVFTTRNGRGRYVFSKLSGVFITCALLCVMFYLTAFIGVYAGGGFAPFSGGGEQIRAISGFVYTPFRMTAAGAALVSFAYTFAACLSLSLLTGCISYYLNNGAAALAASALAIILSFFADGRHYENKNAFMRNCNLAAAVRNRYIFGELRCIDVFGMPVPSYLLNIILLIFSSVVFSALFAVMHLKHAGTELKLPKLKRNAKKEARPAKQHGLFAYEFIKILHSRVITAAILVLFAAGLFINVFSVRYFDYDERVYRHYCQRWEGMTAEEAYPEFLEEGGYIGKCYSAYAALSSGSQYVPENGENVFEMSRYYEKCFGGFDLFNKKISVMLEKAQTGTNDPIVYDGGYSRFFNSGADVFLILTVTLITTYLCTYDRENGTGAVVGTTLLGGKTLSRRRAAASIAMAAAVWAVFTLSSFLSYLTIYGMTGFQYPARVIPGCEEFGDLSLGAVIALIFALRLIGTVFTCILCIGVSDLIGNHLTSFFICASVPAVTGVLLSGSGSVKARAADPALLLDGFGFLRLYPSGLLMAVSALLCIAVPLILYIPHAVRIKRK